MTDDEPSTEDHPEVTDAVQTLMHKLHPQERSALVMKEVLGYSLDEIATTLDTSVGAIKAALNRARGRLHKQSMPPASYAADKEMVNQFLHALQKTDLDTLRSICASELHVELVGGAEMRSFEESKNFFAHAHFVMPEIGFGENPWWRYAEVDHEPLVLGFRTLNGIEGLNEIHRLEVNNGQIARIRCYCFCPDTLAAVAEQINAVALERPYRSPTP